MSHEAFVERIDGPVAAEADVRAEKSEKVGMLDERDAHGDEIEGVLVVDVGRGLLLLKRDHRLHAERTINCVQGSPRP